MNKMRRIIVSLLMGILSTISLSAQHYEIGVNLGGGNYIGDMGSEYYFKPKKIGGGITFKNVVNPWYSMRINLDYRGFNPIDTEAESLGRQKRALSANAYIISLDLGFEYYFKPSNPYKFYRKGHRFHPYIYTGLGIGSLSGTLYKQDKLISNYSGSPLYIPMKIGFKYKIATHLLLGVETGARYYFSDDIDGTHQFYDNLVNGYNDKLIYNSTNLKSNDWSTFTSIGLIYTFGDLRCYFNVE